MTKCGNFYFAKNDKVLKGMEISQKIIKFRKKLRFKPSKTKKQQIFRKQKKIKSERFVGPGISDNPDKSFKNKKQKPKKKLRNLKISGNQ